MRSDLPLMFANMGTDRDDDDDDDSEEKKHEAVPENANPAEAQKASLPSRRPPSSVSASTSGNTDAPEDATRRCSDRESLGNSHNAKPTRDDRPQLAKPNANPVDTGRSSNSATTTSTTTGKLKSAFSGTRDAASGDGDGNEEVANIAQICGRSATGCGYCRGGRTWVLSVKEGEAVPGNGAGAQKSIDKVKDDASNPQDEHISDGSAASQQGSAPDPADEGMNGDGSADSDGDGCDQQMVDAGADIPKDASKTKGATDSSSSSASAASQSYGLIFPSLSPNCYQQLLDTGWRRSGNHLYRPDNFASCCPALSIRLNVQRYRASKSQRRVEKRLQRYLRGDAMGSNGTPARNSRIAEGIASESCSLLNSLRSETIAAIRSHTGCSDQHTPLSIDDDLLSKLCSFKILKNIPKNSIQSLQTEEDSSDRILSVASTSACAAVGGRSKGKVDAGVLAAYVAGTLTKSKSKLDVGEGGLSILAIKTEKGGRVNVYLSVPRKGAKSTEGNAKFDMYVETLRNGDAPYLTRRESKRIDVIADFLRKAQLEMPESYGQGKNQSQLCAREARPLPNASDASNACFGKGNSLYGLTVRSVPSQISASQPEVHRLFAKYQTQIHGDKDPFASVATDLHHTADDDLDRPLDDEEEADHDESTWQRDMYDVNKVYAHMNSRTRTRIKKGYVNFHRFLCETPLPLVQPDGSDDQRFEVDAEGYDSHIPIGSYHQQYRIDGVLIAVGVVDVLPHCLSSVYAFYDPDLSRHLELGKYTALREIEWVKRASAHRQELVHYYLGYYIRSCIKMVYKAEFKPSELLCPTTSRWVDFEAAKKILDEQSPVRQCCTLFTVAKTTNEEDDERHSNRSSLTCNSMYTEQHKSALLESMMLDIGDVGGKGNPPITVSMLNPEGRAMVDPLVREFIEEVGFDVSRRCIIGLS